MSAQLGAIGSNDRASGAEPRDQQQWRAGARQNSATRCRHSRSRSDAWGTRSTIPGDRCRTMHAAMPRFFVDAFQYRRRRATLPAADAEHLARSLRARPGETIVVVEGSAVEHGVQLQEVTTSRVSGTVVWSRPVDRESRVSSPCAAGHSAQAMDATIEALIVAGAASIHPVHHRAHGGASRTRRERHGERSAGRLSRAKPHNLQGVRLLLSVHRSSSLRDALAHLSGCSRVLSASSAAGSIRCCPLIRGRAGIGSSSAPKAGSTEPDLDVARDSRRATTSHLGPRTLPSRLAGAIATSLLLAGVRRSRPPGRTGTANDHRSRPPDARRVSPSSAARSISPRWQIWQGDSRRADATSCPRRTGGRPGAQLLHRHHAGRRHNATAHRTPASHRPRCASRAHRLQRRREPRCLHAGRLPPSRTATRTASPTRPRDGTHSARLCPQLHPRRCARVRSSKCRMDATTGARTASSGAHAATRPAFPPGRARTRPRGRHAGHSEIGALRRRSRFLRP